MRLKLKDNAVTPEKRQRGHEAIKVEKRRGKRLIDAGRQYGAPREVTAGRQSYRSGEAESQEE